MTMYYKLVKDPEGAYVDADGMRYEIAAARRMRSPQGVNADYVEFPSLAAALAAWGLQSVGMDIGL